MIILLKYIAQSENLYYILGCRQLKLPISNPEQKIIAGKIIYNNSPEATLAMICTSIKLVEYVAY